MKSTPYEICLVHKDGSEAYLEHKGRRVWSWRTAKKHVRDILTGKTGIDMNTIQNIRLTSPL